MKEAKVTTEQLVEVRITWESVRLVAVIRNRCLGFWPWEGLSDIERPITAADVSYDTLGFLKFARAIGDAMKSPVGRPRKPKGISSPLDLLGNPDLDLKITLHGKEGVGEILEA